MFITFSFSLSVAYLGQTLVLPRADTVARTAQGSNFLPFGKRACNIHDMSSNLANRGINQVLDASLPPAKSPRAFSDL